MGTALGKSEKNFGQCGGIKRKRTGFGARFMQGIALIHKLPCALKMPFPKEWRKENFYLLT